MKLFCELNWSTWGVGIFVGFLRPGGGIAVMVGPVFFGVEWVQR